MIQTTIYDMKNIRNNPIEQKKLRQEGEQDHLFGEMFVQCKGQGEKEETKTEERKETVEREETKSEKSCKEETRDLDLEILKLGVLWNQMMVKEGDTREQELINGGEEECIFLDGEIQSGNLSFYEEMGNEKGEVLYTVEQNDGETIPQTQSILRGEGKIQRQVNVREGAEEQTIEGISEKIGRQELPKEEQYLIQENASKEEKEKLENNKISFHDEEDIEENVEKKADVESDGMKQKQWEFQGMPSSMQIGERRSLAHTEKQKDMPVLLVPEIEQLPNKVTQQLETQIMAGIKELELELEPANLGKITMKISYESGKANISLVCSKSDTLKILSEQAEYMGTLIEKHLGNPTEVYVEKQESGHWDQQNGEQRNNQNSQQQREEQERRYYKKLKETKSQDFLQQLRIGLR